jgi:hypothetical protein
MAGDVLEKSESWLALSEDAFDVRPEVAWVICSSALSGERERLAGVAARDDIHDSTPRASVEGSHVVPDRSRVQGAVCHARNQDRSGMGFPLHSNGAAVGVSESEMESKFQPSDSGTKSQPIHEHPESDSRSAATAAMRFMASPPS